jgi:hypothetical protein
VDERPQNRSIPASHSEIATAQFGVEKSEVCGAGSADTEYSFGSDSSGVTSETVTSGDSASER